MKDTVYIVVDRLGARRMTKSLPSLNRGEIPIKLELTVEPSAFQTPTLTRQVRVEDWRQGIDVADVEFRETFITEEEAAIIRQHRLEKMAEILTNQGYSVTQPQVLDDATAG